MQAATLTAVVVFPTPPFWLAMAYTVLIRRPTVHPRAVGSAPNHAFGTPSRNPATHPQRTAAALSPFPPGAGTGPAARGSAGTPTASAAPTRRTGRRARRQAPTGPAPPRPPGRRLPRRAPPRPPRPPTRPPDPPPRPRY